MQCSQLLWNCAKIKAVCRARGERGLDIAQTIGPNCSMTHSPGKIEYNCRYFIMTFRTQIPKKNSVKNVFVIYSGYYVSSPVDQYLKLKNCCSLLRAFVNCALVLKNAYISSFFTGKRRNKDHSALVNCGGIEFLKLR